jgi:hypothetical protein
VSTLRELRAIEEQVAKELGQLVDKRELTGKDGGPLQVATVERMSDAQIAQEIERIIGSVGVAVVAENDGAEPNTEASAKA